MSISNNRECVAAVYESKELRGAVDALRPAAIHAHIVALPVHSSSVGPASDRLVLRESFVFALGESARCMTLQALREAVLSVLNDPQRRDPEAEIADEAASEALLASLHLSEADVRAQEALNCGSSSAEYVESASKDAASAVDVAPLGAAVASTGAFLRRQFHDARARNATATGEAMATDTNNNSSGSIDGDDLDEEEDLVHIEIEHLRSISQRDVVGPEASSVESAQGPASKQPVAPTRGRLKLWSRRGTPPLLPQQPQQLSSSSDTDSPSPPLQPQHSGHQRTSSDERRRPTRSRRRSRSPSRASSGSLGSAASMSTASTAGSELSDLHMHPLHRYPRRHHSYSHHESHHRRQHGRPSRRHHSAGLLPRQSQQQQHSPSSSPPSTLFKSVSVDNLVSLFRRKSKSSSSTSACGGVMLNGCGNNLQLKSILKTSTACALGGTSARAQGSPSASARSRRRFFVSMPFFHHNSSSNAHNDKHSNSDDERSSHSSVEKHVRFGTCRMISQTGEVVGCMQLCNSVGNDEEREELVMT